MIIQSHSMRSHACIVGLLLSMAGFAPASAQAHKQSASGEHFSVEMPASLSPVEAEEVYRQILDDMVSAYALSQDPSTTDYRRWRRFNSSAYPSAPHGTRYVNVYGNALAKAYGLGGQTMPEGAVLAKDAFAVTDRGDAFAGPLFLMEKMQPGFDAGTGDWRYSMIMPDGSFFGVTGGDNADQVRFCATCHEDAGRENDYLFFVPEAYRIDD